MPPNAVASLSVACALDVAAPLAPGSFGLPGWRRCPELALPAGDALAAGFRYIIIFFVALGLAAV